MYLLIQVNVILVFWNSAFISDHYAIFAIDNSTHTQANASNVTKRITQETIEALGGMDIMPKHSDICRCRYVCIFKLLFR